MAPPAAPPPDNALLTGTEVFTAGCHAAAGWLLEKGDPRRSEQQGGTCVLGDADGGGGLRSSLPTTAAFGVMPQRTKLGHQGPKSVSPV